jgi:hypothetical protein
MTLLAIAAELAVVAEDQMPSKHTSRMFALRNASMLQYQIIFEAPAQRHLTEAQPLPCLLGNEAPLGRAPNRYPPRPTQTSEGRMYALQVH